MAGYLRRVLLESGTGGNEKGFFHGLGEQWKKMGKAGKTAVIGVPVALSAGTIGYLLYKKRKKKQQEELGDTIGDVGQTMSSPGEGMSP
ncbi:MAG: hypothetical protein QXD03_04805 [Candidatus Anstonellales archaeon]